MVHTYNVSQSNNFKRIICYKWENVYWYGTSLMTQIRTWVLILTLISKFGPFSAFQCIVVSSQSMHKNYDITCHLLIYFFYSFFDEETGFRTYFPSLT